MAQVNDVICVERFDDFPQLGRFTLRDEGEIFGCFAFEDNIYAIAI